MKVKNTVPTTVTIDENVVYVKYKDNETLYFPSFHRAQQTQKSYVTTLKEKQLSTVQSIREKDMSLSKYKDFSQVRALSTLTYLAEKYTIQAIDRPLELFDTSYDRSTNFYKIETISGSIDDIVSTLQQDNSVEYVESGKLTVTYLQSVSDVTVNDEYLLKQWHLR